MFNLVYKETYKSFNTSFEIKYHLYVALVEPESQINRFNKSNKIAISDFDMINNNDSWFIQRGRTCTVRGAVL